MDKILHFMMIVLLRKHRIEIKELCEELNISKRTMYRYVETLDRCGFSIFIRDHCVMLDKQSPVFKELDALMYFNRDEAVSLYNAIDTVEIHSDVKQQLKDKLMSLYGTKEVRDKIIRLHASEKVKNLMEAIQQHKVVRIVGYSSPSSQTKKDRLVEPFKIGEEYKMVWCYELESGMNKVFMISRMEEVCIEDLTWRHEPEHRSAFTDAFHMISFSGKTYPVRLLMNRRATELMREEYPLTEQDIRYIGMEYWEYKTEVSSYVGVGRFVLGLLDCIKIMTPELQEYCMNYVNRNLFS